MRFTDGFQGISHCFTALSQNGKVELQAQEFRQGFYNEIKAFLLRKTPNENDQRPLCISQRYCFAKRHFISFFVCSLSRSVVFWQCRIGQRIKKQCIYPIENTLKLK